MRNRWLIAAAMAVLALPAGAGELRHGVLTVDGKPFFPLGSWNFGYTRPQDIARLGMNTSFWGAYDPSAKGVEAVRKRMRDCRAYGLQLIAYVTPGPVKTGWSDAQARSFATLAREPNLLAWYVGDDIKEPQLPAMEATVTHLRRWAPGVPAVADFIGKDTAQAAQTYRRYVDIRCCYDYPVSDKPIRTYMGQFDRYRAFAGDPMWTWVQNFMWGGTGRRYNLGGEGPGPIPDPEQVRLLSFAAINRGVRGLLYFSHRELHRLPEVAAEVALTCREAHLFNDRLAAGKLTMNLPTSDPEVNAAAYRYGPSTVLSAMVIKPFYQRWIDEAVVPNVTIECAWPRGPLPRALLVKTPDLVACRVSRVPGKAAIRVTLPSLELCGFVLVTRDASTIARLRSGVRAVAKALCGLAPGAAAAQTRKVAGVAWQTGLAVSDSDDDTVKAARLADASGDAAAAGNAAGAVRYWQEALRVSRRLVGRMMAEAAERSDAIPASRRYFLDTPYALFNIPGLGQAPKNSDPWCFVTRWAVAGPFPLGFGGDVDAPPASGFLRAYLPETSPAPSATFETVDGPGHWMDADTQVSGLLDFRKLFRTTDDVVAYAEVAVTAPRDMKATIGLGSNDGARVWLNGKLVFSWWGGRSARQNEDKFDVELHKGASTLLVKVANLGADWQLFLAFSDPARELRFGVK